MSNGSHWLLMGTNNAGLRHPISASKLPNNFGKMKQQIMKDPFKHRLAGGKLLVSKKWATNNAFSCKTAGNFRPRPNQIVQGQEKTLSKPESRYNQARINESRLYI